MAVNPQHRYSNEAENMENASQVIHDDLKLKSTLWFIPKYFSAVRVKPGGGGSEPNVTCDNYMCT